MRLSLRIKINLSSFLFLLNSVVAQQVPDLGYKPPISNPAYQKGDGPLVGIDEAHYNFHTATGRYAPFANLLLRDGYRVARVRESFSENQLKPLDVLVIANPLHKQNDGNWKLPIPSAFTKVEIKAVHKWVEEGGSLFLIADHMPFPGAVDDLAKSFGFRFSNGYAELGNHRRGSPDIYKKNSGLMVCAVTQGRNDEERVSKVVTFTGSAFRAPEEAKPVLVFPKHSISKEPEVAWEFTGKTVQVPVEGWLQGAIMKVGNGRVAVFGEAAMFTAQLAGPQKRRMGMGASYANENYQLLLNVMHWLSDLEGMREEKSE